MAVVSSTPNNSEENSFALAHAQLQRQFVAGLPKRQAEIMQASNHKTRLATLHRLAGASGSFGFPALSILAQQAMQIQEQQHDQENKPESHYQLDKVFTDTLQKIYLEINCLSHQWCINPTNESQ